MRRCPVCGEWLRVDRWIVCPCCGHVIHFKVKKGKKFIRVRAIPHPPNYKISQK